jgi:hypothetical protein
VKNADRNSEPLDAILRRAMRELPGAVTPECADPESLAAYWDRSMDAPARERFEAHLADCARCQMQLASIARADESALVASADSKIPWYRGLGFAIPALAAAAAVFVFIAIRRPANEPSHSTEVVAMAKREAPAASAPEPPAETVAAAPAAAQQAPTAAPPAPASNEIAMNEARRAEAKNAEAQRVKQPHRMEHAHSPEVRMRGESTESALPNAGAPAEGGRVVAIAPAAPFTAATSAVQPPPAMQLNSSVPNAVAMNQPQPEAAQLGESTSQIQQQQPVQREKSRSYAPQALSQQATVPNAAPIVAGGGAGAGAGAPLGGTAIGAASGAIIGAAVGSPSAAAPGGASAAIGGAHQKSAETRSFAASSSGGASAGAEVLVMISPPDQSVTWIAGKNGVVRQWRRYDAGTALQFQHSGVTTDLVAGAAPSAKVCWIVGRSGTIIRTTDGGEHWTLITPPAMENLATVSASSASDAAITTAGGRKFATFDGGMSWHPQ